jgi:uncharacterized protein (DUF1786 family)
MGVVGVLCGAIAMGDEMSDHEYDEEGMIERRFEKMTKLELSVALLMERQASQTKVIDQLSEKVESLTTLVQTMSTTFAENRGALRLMKVIGALVIGVGAGWVYVIVALNKLVGGK